MAVNSTPSIFSLNNFKYGENYAIEASAGTGKTYNITEIVKKLIAEHSLGLDKILIVTYTEKAAGELKNRIREILTKPVEEYSGKSIQEYFPNVNTDIDNASIGTIHSFCKNTITEFVVSSNQVNNLELASDNDLDTFAKQYIRKGNILNDIITFFNYGYELDEEKLIERIKSALNSYYLDFNYNENENIIQYEKTVKTNPFDELHFKLVLSDDFEGVLQKNDPNLYNDYLLLKNSNNLVGKELAYLIKNFKDFISDGKTITSYGVNINNGFTKEEKAAFKNLYELKTKALGFKEDVFLIDKYITDIYKEFEIYKKEHRIQTFNDMIRVIHELLMQDGSKLLELLRNKYKYAIIDEFQDTNELQFNIFSKIFLSPNHNIIVVGDPKQSIYGYQGADINVYKKAVDIIEKNGQKCRLAKNYRSAPGVIEFGNELFKNYDFLTPFEPSLYCNVQDDGKEKRLKYKGSYASSLWLNSAPLDQYEYAKFAVEQIVDLVSKNSKGETNLQLSYMDEGKIKYRNVTFGDFVVLARTRSEMKPIKNELEKAGIPVIKYKDNALFSGIECAHWIALLEAINVPDFTGYNRGYFKKALITKFFDISLNDINNQIYDDDSTPEFSLFNKWRILAKEKLWQDLFDEILIDTEIDKKMSSLSDIQSLAIFKQIASYSIDYLSKDKDIIDLIKFLRNVSKYGDDELNDTDISNVIKKSTDFDCVRIMTMHASKGLQFPIVISTGGFKKMHHPDGACFDYHDIGNSGKEVRKLAFFKHDNYEIEQINEFKRIYYVAYTRSEYLLIAPRYAKIGLGFINIFAAMETFLNSCINKTFTVDNTNIPYYDIRDFKNRPLSQIKKDVSLILSDKKQSQIDNDASKKQIDMLKDLIKIKNKSLTYKHSYSSLAHPKNNGDETSFDDNLNSDKEGESVLQMIEYDESAKQIIGFYDGNLSPIEIPNRFPKGASLGNAIHEVFERLDFTNYEENLNNVILDRFLNNGFDFSNNNEALTYVRDIVGNVLNAKLPIVKGGNTCNGYFSLNQIVNSNKKAEIEFNFNYPNEKLKNYLNGFMDLLFKRDNVYSILDWKSDLLNDNFESYSDEKELKKQVDDRYSIQRVLYSYCLIKWLKQFYNESEEEIFNNHFGGIYYVFVRGANKNTSNGVYIQTWDSWDDLNKEFNKILKMSKRQ